MKNSPQTLNVFDTTYTENAELFGHPYKELQDYFTQQTQRGTLLDLGSGQGRDALFLASLGYDVTAVDSSAVGIQQMRDEAAKKGISITGIVDDILTVELEKSFDVILCDMLLHSFEEVEQKILLKKCADALNKEGILCIVFPDDMTTQHFMDLLQSLSPEWTLLDEITITDVPKMKDEESDYTFVMIVVQKVTE